MILKNSAKEILQQMEVGDVWGIGRKISTGLNLQGINNAFQLSILSPKAIRREFSGVTERTVNELNGISCLSCDEVREDKQQIFSTRSFGQKVTDVHALHAAFFLRLNYVALDIFKSIQGYHSDGLPPPLDIKSPLRPRSACRRIRQHLY